MIHDVLRSVTPCGWVHNQRSGVKLYLHFRCVQKKTAGTIYQSIRCHSAVSTGVLNKNKIYDRTKEKIDRQTDRENKKKAIQKCITKKEKRQIIKQ